MKYSLSKLDYNSILGLGSIDYEEDQVFDLSNLEFATPDGVVLFRLILHRISSQNERDVKIILPDSESGKYNVRRYLVHINMFSGLDLSLQIKDKIYHLTGKFLPEEKNSLTHTSIIDTQKYDLKTKMNDLVFVLVNFLEENGLIRKNKETLYRNVFEEAFLNHRNHSNPNKEYAYFCAQSQVYQKTKPKIVVAIGDCGVGIKRSLNTHYNFENNEEAIKAAIIEEKSRFAHNEDRGGGARFIFEKCRDLKLHCCYRSGTAEIKRLKGDQNFKIQKTPFYPGTQVFLWN